MKRRGISLIVLSITILVMAILAATVIIALEDSGIIGRSKNTTAKQNYTEEYTRLQVIKNGVLTDNLGTISVDEYITELTNKGLIESGVTTNADGSKSVTTKTGFVANVMQDGESNVIISLGTSNATITLNPTSLSGDITSGAVTKTITVNATNVTGDITWTTSNANVATVPGTNSSATVTLKGIGSATITATYGNAKATCNVNVTGTVVTPTITLNKTTTSKTINSGSTATETITAPTQNITGALTWTSSNTSVATVSGSGNTATITMKAAGTAAITAKNGSTSASCTVTVTVNKPLTVSITSATVDPTSLSNTALKDITITTNLSKSVLSSPIQLKYEFFKVLQFDGTTTSYEKYNLTKTTTDTVDTYIITPETVTATTCVLIRITALDMNGNILATQDIETVKSENSSWGITYSYSIGVICLPAGTMITVEEEYVDENGKKRKVRKRKKIEDLTYDDDLVVWDFDNACFTITKPLWLKEKEYADEYNVLTFSDGSTLKTIRQHRIFNKELGKFTYPMTDETPLGTTTFNVDGKEVTLVSKEVVEEKVPYYNVISNYHMNVFAEGILTSCRLSNLYEIKDMKYVKEDRELIDVEELNGIPEEYIKGLRLLEQPKDINRGNADNHGNTLKEYVMNLIRLAKKK